MTNEVVITLLVGLTGYVKDAFLWGSTGYVVFRRLGGRDSRWWLGILGLALVYLIFEVLVAQAGLNAMRLLIGEPSVAEFAGDEISALELDDFIEALIVPAVGFLLAMRLFSRLFGGGATLPAGNASSLTEEEGRGGTERDNNTEGEQLAGSPGTGGAHMDQAQVDRLLRWGIVFSLVWLAGLGSLFAFIVGYKTRKAIALSSDTLEGKGRAMWCLIVGGLGLIVWVPILVISMAN